MKKRITLVVLVSLIALSSYCYSVWKNKQLLKNKSAETPVHSCAEIPEYSYNSDIGACTKIYQFNAEKAEQAKIAVRKLKLKNDLVGTFNSIYVNDVETLKCPNCYKVTLDTGDKNYIYIINVTNLNADEVKKFTRNSDTKEVLTEKDYKCPDSKWVNCMPGPSTDWGMCTTQYLGWAKRNCPEFEGAQY